MSDRGGGPGRAQAAALAAMLVVAVVLYLVGQAVVHRNRMQDCLDAGRRDCATRVD